jgi:GH25 family lysozyme M1 (1,4-beta-N-acetylmuramidase)
VSQKWLDLSNYQHPGNAPIDFAKVRAAGVDGVVLKATEGTGYVNPYYAGDHAAALAAKLEVAAYAFLRPENGNPDAQVDFFVNTVAQHGPVSWYANDCETGSGDLTAFVLEALAHLQARTHAAVLYTGGWWAGSHLNRDAKLAQYPLWDASYSNAEPTPPHPWKSLFAWQYTDKEQVPGIRGNVDASQVYASAPVTKPVKPAPPAKEEDVISVEGKQALVRLIFLAVLGRQPQSDQEMANWVNNVHDDLGNLDHILQQIAGSQEGQAFGPLAGRLNQMQGEINKLEGGG